MPKSEANRHAQSCHLERSMPRAKRIGTRNRKIPTPNPRKRSPKEFSRTAAPEEARNREGHEFTRATRGDKKALASEAGISPASPPVFLRGACRERSESARAVERSLPSHSRDCHFRESSRIAAAKEARDRQGTNFTRKPSSPVVEGGSFWQPRYYDFNVWSEPKRIDKLRYIHRNPVRRGLVSSPEQWAWSSFRHYLSGVEGVVEIESQWTARKREQLGVVPQITGSQIPRPDPAPNAGTRTEHPRD